MINNMYALLSVRYNIIFIFITFGYYFLIIKIPHYHIDSGPAFLAERRPCIIMNYYFIRMRRYI